MFSIIIVNYNTKKVLNTCLQGIFNNWQSVDKEVIVIDNNSQDGSQKMLSTGWSSKIRVINNDKNLGFGSANNQGAAIAQGDWLFFLNSDCVVDTDILLALQNILVVNKNLGILSPVILDSSGKLQKRSFGKFPNLFNTVLAKFYKEKKLAENLKYIDWVSGAAMIVKKEVFLSVEGFDKHFFMYFEDIDICRQAKRLGYQVAVCPQNISLVHQGGLSLGSNNKLRKQYYYSSQDYYFFKYYGQVGRVFIKILRQAYLLIKK